MHFNQESVFLSGIRSLCKALGAILGIFMAVFIGLIAISSATNSNFMPEKSEMRLAADANGSRKLLSPSSPAILRINLQGVIGLDKLSSSQFQDLLYDSQEEPLGANRIKAIFLYVDTPGGAATDSATMYQALMEYKKKHNIPVYAFVDGLCASGGMYICSAADKIYATSSSVIGSVGVLMGPNFNFSDLMTTVGVGSLTITQGKDKDALNPFRPWKIDEEAPFIEITKQLYEQFVDVVVSGRPLLTKEKLIQEYGANVFLAPTAEKLGYIDVAGADYARALQDLVIAANIADKEYQVIELSSPENFLSQLAKSKFGLLSGKVEHVFPMGPLMRSELNGKPLYLYQP